MKKNAITKLFYVIGIISTISSVVILLAFIIIRTVNSEPDTFSYNDGPYIIYPNDSMIKTIEIKENKATVFDIIENEINIKDTSEINRISKVYEGFSPFEKFRFSPIVEYNAEKIGAVSDIHGSFHHLRKLLCSNKIINNRSDWIWGDGHLVIAGDIFDKGSYVTECLWLIKKLEAQAGKQGGRVHFLLGNHEKLILNGDNNYMGLKYREICKRLFVSYDQLFAADTYWGQWLRSKNIIVKINNNLFTHGGISEQMADKQYTLSNINKYFNSWVNSKNLMNYDLKTRASFSLIVNSFGPMEYRGYFNKNIFNRKQASAFPDQTVDKILKYYNAGHIIVGHTIVREIKGLFNNRVIAINNRYPEDDIVDKKSDCEMLIIEGTDYYKAGLNGERTILFSEKTETSNLSDNN